MSKQQKQYELNKVEKMKTYKSPVQLKPSNMQKKSSINFVKNVAAPKQIKTQNILNAQNFEGNRMYTQVSQPLIEKFRAGSGESIWLIINNECRQIGISVHSNSGKNITKPLVQRKKPSKKSIRVKFPFSPQTQIKHMISFIQREVQQSTMYVKSDDIYVDFILGLKQFKVKELVELLKREQEQNEQHSEDGPLELEVTCCEYENVNNDNYLKNFQIIKCVGSGGFSKVYLVRGFGKLMAMKVINKDFILSNDKSNIINNEKTILSICSDHPFITKLQASFETNNFLIFVMEFCNGGQLFNLLRKVRRMKEQDAKFYFVQTLTAIVYLHQKGIVYRDIKPQNIIIDYQGHVRLADYGLSKIMEDCRQGKTYSFCGSAEYMAPQMLLKKGHSFEIDFYCLGALLYELVIGLPPYYSRNQNELFSNIIYNDLEFPEHVQLSEELKNFLQMLLQKSVQNRYKTIQEILSHPWMENINFDSVLQKSLKPPFKTDMFGYNFDDSDFAEEQNQITQNLINQQSYSTFEELKFPDFFYESKQTIDIKSVIAKSKQQGHFLRSVNNNIGEFIAESYQSRNISNHVSLFVGAQNSRQPSTNKYDHSNIITMPLSSQIARRGNSNQYQGQQSPIKQIPYYPPDQKPHIHTVRSVGHINTSKPSLHTHSQERLSSLAKNPSFQTNHGNIYTSHKQAFHPLGAKVASMSNLITSSNTRNVPYARQQNYYSVPKSNRGQGIRLNIQDLKIKNQRNYSVQKFREPYSTNTLTYSLKPQNSNSFLKQPTSSQDLKMSYLDSFRDKQHATGKVKKSYLKTGEKISITSLNNVHYRN